MPKGSRKSAYWNNEETSGIGSNMQSRVRCHSVLLKYDTYIVYDISVFGNFILISRQRPN